MKSEKLVQCIFVLALIFISVSLPGDSSADSLDRWLWRNPIPQVGFVSKIAYGNGTFVAVGGAISSSPNGVPWTVRLSDLAAPLSGVAYGSGVFVAVGANGKVLTSPDGINWTTIEAQIKDDLKDVIFGNGIFVAVGPYTSLVSSDGLNWTIKTTGNSVDGGYTYDATHLAYGNGTFISVGINGAIFSSVDGLCWTQRYTPNIFTAHSFSEPAVTYGNGKFVVVGWRGQPLIAPGAIILTSPDGVNWTERTLETANQLVGLTYGNGLFVAAGNNGTVFTSPDAVNWTNRVSGTTKSLSVAAYVNGIFVATGNGIVLTSPDGVTWTVTIDGNINDLYGVDYGQGIYIAVGDKGTILYSQDGINWKGAVSGTTSRFFRAAYGNGVFVVLGDNGTLLRSPDGLNWNSVITSSADGLNDVTYGGGTFVAAGENGRIITSSDGLTWTERISGTSNRLSGITYGKGDFVTVGDYETILTSPDGANWTARRSGTASLHGLSYGNGLFVVAGEVFYPAIGFAPPPPPSSIILTSVDGMNWTADISGPHFKRITYGSGTFVALYPGYFGTVSTSPDGINWSTRILENPPVWLGDVTYGNNTFLAVGRNGAILQTDSANGICAATLSDDLELHVPIIDFFGKSYWANFQVITDALEIKLTNYGSITDTGPFAGCRSASLSPDLSLHIPTILFGGISYLADFQYSHDSSLALIGGGQEFAAMPYQLSSESTYQEGCVGPCLCPITVGGRISGTFNLIQLNPTPLFSRFSLDDISWTVTNPDGSVAHTITGFGIYQTGGEFAKLHQLVLEVSIDNSDLMHFDSGLISDESQFPAISISIDRGTNCYDIFMKIVASPRR